LRKKSFLQKWLRGKQAVNTESRPDVRQDSGGIENNDTNSAKAALENEAAINRMQIIFGEVTSSEWGRACAALSPG